jgi:hypothetical protein
MPVLLAALVAVSGTAPANGVWNPPSGPPESVILPWVLFYEFLVVAIEWRWIRDRFQKRGARAFLLSLSANTASFLAGIPVGYGIWLAVEGLWSPLPMLVGVVAMLAMNILLEGWLIAWVGQIPAQDEFWRQIRRMNACTWLVGLFLVYLPFYAMGGPGRRSNVSRVRMEMRSMATGIEAYYVDHDSYPTTTPLVLFARDAEALRAAGGYSLGTIEPGKPRFSLSGITTPVAYVAAHFPDVFANQPELPFVYYVDTSGWMLISPGPDGKYDMVPERVYTSLIAQPSPTILGLAYDPTNGTISGGDIFRVKN